MFRRRQLPKTRFFPNRLVAGLVVDYRPRHDRRQKRICLRLVPGRLLVSFPAGVKTEAVDRFIDDHVDWISARARPLPSYHSGQRLARGWQLEIEPGCRRRISSGRLLVSDDRQRIEAGIKVLLKRLSTTEVEPRARDLTATTGLGSPGRWRFAYFSSCWGNCRWQTELDSGAISLNTALVNLPDELVDLVIIHELCHLKLRRPGHGPEFWLLLESHLPAARSLSRRLSRDFRPGLLPTAADEGVGLGLVD